MSEYVIGDCELDIIGPGFTADGGDPHTGKPYLRLSFPGELFGTTRLCLTLNLAEMIGGAAAGARKRWEDQHGPDDARAKN
jgi:hypothetical protein